MSIDDARRQADALLTESEAPATQTPTFMPQVASLGDAIAQVPTTDAIAQAPTAGTASRAFSPFIPAQMEQAIELAASLMEIADNTTSLDGLTQVIAAAEQARNTYGLDLVKYALMIFMTHHPLGKQFSIPPIEARAPEKLIPSSPSIDANLPTAAGSGSEFDVSTLDLEAPLAWYREDPKANEHHEHWHVVYPHAGIRANLHNPAVLKDRQDELFLYMHQQMLARYDTERLALDMARVLALTDYNAPIAEGYDPGTIRSSQGTLYVARPARMQISDLGDFQLAKFIAHDDHVSGAIDDGFFIQNGEQTPITSNLLGATLEASIGSAALEEGQGEGALLPSVYGNLHNYGHVFIGYITDPINEQQAGVMLDTATAIRDPVFYRWHKHIDDFSFRWQEKQAANDFSDAPPVLLRKSLGATITDNGSPDIILAFRGNGSGDAHVIPGSSASTFDGQSYGQQHFGGANWNTDFSVSDTTTNELHTYMFQRNITLSGSEENVTINYLDAEKEFFYFLRVENQAAQPTDVTVRIFLVAKQVAEDRRMWIEMDKFHYTLPASQQTVIFRPASLSSVIRKPAVRPPAAVMSPHTAGGTTVSAEDMNNYCDCGWPYNLLLPRGTRDGMPFRLLVMLTDWNIDRVAEDTHCGSMSFCGAKDRYPDTRAMGYPFDRPFAPGTSIASTLSQHNNMATRDITIRWQA